MKSLKSILTTLSNILTVLSTVFCRYYKLNDPGNWITVVESTGELKVANTIDRESPLVSNDRYNISIKAVDESKFCIITVNLM